MGLIQFVKPSHTIQNTEFQLDSITNILTHIENSKKEIEAQNDVGF